MMTDAAVAAVAAVADLTNSRRVRKLDTPHLPNARYGRLKSNQKGPLARVAEGGKRITTSATKWYYQ